MGFLLKSFVDNQMINCSKKFAAMIIMCFINFYLIKKTQVIIYRKENINIYMYIYIYIYINDFVYRSPSYANFPAMREPSRLLKSDCKCLDGITPIPWMEGNALHGTQLSAIRLRLRNYPPCPSKPVII